MPSFNFFKRPTSSPTDHEDKPSTSSSSHSSVTKAEPSSSSPSASHHLQHEDELSTAVPTRVPSPSHSNKDEIPHTTSTDPSDEEKALPPAKKEELADQTNLLPLKQVLIVFAGLSMAIVVTLLDQTIVATALPEITKSLAGEGRGSGSDASWVATAFLLTGTASQPLYGRFSDIFGRKIVLLAAMGIFAVGSLACALSQTLLQLIIFRAISGMGGGGILTGAMIIISDVVSLRDRGKYQGIIGVAVALANGTGPVIGGLLAVKTSWRWCFWINLPLSGFAIAVVTLGLPLKRVKGKMVEKLLRIDYTGSILVLASTILMIIGLTWGGVTYPWSSAAVLCTLIIGAFIFVAFCFWEWKGPRFPLMPMYIYKNVTVNGVFVGTVFNGLIFFIALFYLAQYYQIVHGYSAILSGVLILPLVITQTVVSFITGVIISRTGHYKANIVLGWAIWAIGLGLVATFDRSTSIARSCGFLVLVGVGAGQTFQSSLIAAQAAVDRKDMAVVTGLRNFLRQLGGTFGLAFANTIVNNTLRSELSRHSGADLSVVREVLDQPTEIHSSSFPRQDLVDPIIEAYTKGFQRTFYLCAGCAVVGFLATAIFVKHHSLRRGDDKENKEKSKKWLEERKERRKGRKQGEKVAEAEEPKSEEVEMGKAEERT